MDPQISRLLLAAEQGNLFMVTALLDKGIHVDSTDEEGVNALHSAAANGNENVVRLLLSRGASLEARNIYGWTALMLASYYGHVMVCWILIQHKSDICAEGELGSTALDCAARSGHVQIVALLIEADGQQVRDPPTKLCLETPLMNAAQHGHEAALKLLLEKGADVNYRDEITGWTPLMVAALNGHMTAAQILVEFGADTNVLNVIDQTALEIAVARQKTEVQGFLDERTSTRPQIKGKIVNCFDLIRFNLVPEQRINVPCVYLEWALCQTKHDWRNKREIIAATKGFIEPICVSNNTLLPPVRGCLKVVFCLKFVLHEMHDNIVDCGLLTDVELLNS